MPTIALPGNERTHRRTVVCPCCGQEESEHIFTYVRHDNEAPVGEEVVYNLYCPTPYPRFKADQPQRNKRMSVSNWNALMNAEIYVPAKAS